VLQLVDLMKAIKVSPAPTCILTSVTGDLGRSKMQTLENAPQYVTRSIADESGHMSIIRLSNVTFLMLDAPTPHSL
jgi:hypothetical protein